MKEQLMEEARRVRQQAYAPYSQFSVGAALRLHNGMMFMGANMETISFGATLCAERIAFAMAITAGYRRPDFHMLAVAGDTELFLPPCGLCLQTIAEFADATFPILLTKRDGQIKETMLGELLPEAFTSLA